MSFSVNNYIPHMKSIKIKLNYSNPVKLQKLFDIFVILSSVSKEYLPLRQKELETKEFKPLNLPTAKAGGFLLSGSFRARN